MKNRVLWIDTLRGVAVFAVVLGHTLRNATAVYPWLYCFHVPMCVFVSGLVLAQPQQRLAQFAKKKFFSLMVPYYCFAIPSILLYAVIGQYMENSVGGGYNLTLIDSMWGMLFANAGNGLMRWNMPLWYIPMIFVMFLVAYFVYKKRMDIKYSCVVATVSALIAYTCYVFFHLDGLPFGCETVIYLFPFFALGVFIKNHIPKMESTPWHIRMIVGIAFIALGTILSPENGQISYNADYYGRNGYLYFLLTATCLTVGFMLCVSVCTNGVRGINYVGRNTLPIMLMHKFPILFFVSLLGITKRFVSTFPLIGSIVIAMLSIGMSCIAAEIIYRIFPRMLGKRKV